MNVGREHGQALYLLLCSGDSQWQRLPGGLLGPELSRALSSSAVSPPRAPTPAFVSPPSPLAWGFRIPVSSGIIPPSSFRVLCQWDCLWRPADPESCHRCPRGLSLPRCPWGSERLWGQKHQIPFLPEGAAGVRPVPLRVFVLPSLHTLLPTHRLRCRHGRMCPGL